ncbi:MAG: hypothetical protein ACRDOI_31530 [Trebonia sp.]
MRIFSRSRIAAIALVIATSIAGPVGSAAASPSPPDPGGIPDLLYSQSDWVHKCTVIGGDGTFEAVICVDLTTTTYGVVTAKAEAVCQTYAGHEVQCANVILRGVWAFGNPARARPTALIKCGHLDGPCSTGRNFTTMGSLNAGQPHCSPQYVSSDAHTWAVIYGGGKTAIELPVSGKMVYLNTSNSNDSGSESTGHYYVCE